MIRKAVKQDVEPIMEIIRATIEEMKSYGNTQWNDRYPWPAILRRMWKTATSMWMWRKTAPWLGLSASIA